MTHFFTSNKLILYYFIFIAITLKSQVVVVAGYTISAIPVATTVEQMAVDQAGKKILFTGPNATGSLYSYNITTGITTSIAANWAANNINCWYPYASTDIEYHNTYLYSCIPNNISSRDSIAKTNVASGVSSVIVSPTMPAGLTGIEGGAAFIGNKYYFTSPNASGSIFCLDLNTMAIVTYSVGIPLVSYHTLEYNPVDDRLYVSAGNALYKVNLTTQTLTSIGNLNSATFSQFVLDPNGLYAWTQDGSSVYKMSLATGASTVIVNTLGGGNYQDLKFGPSTGSCNVNGTSLYIGNNNNLLELKGFANTIAALSIPTLTYCLGSTFKLPYLAIGNYCSGNIFTAQLSNAAGSFAAPIAIGTQTTTSGADTLVCTIPTTLTAGTGYKIRITSSNPVITGYSSAMTLTVIASPVPSVAVNSGSLCAGGSFTLLPSGASSYTFSGGSAVVSPTATTSYSVIGTSSVGCVSSAIAIGTVTVASSPTITANSGAICIGNSFTITPAGAVSYTISGGAAVVNPTTITSYSITGTSPAGCVSLFAAIATLTVNALPLITTSTDHTIICAQENAILSANGANTYTWLPFGTGPNILVSPGSTTNYTVTGTDSNGCINTNTITQLVSPCTGIHEPSTANTEFALFPNPFNTAFSVIIHAAQAQAITDISIYNAAGALVYALKTGNKFIEISLKEQAPGLYFVKLITTEGLRTLKVIKE